MGNKDIICTYGRPGYTPKVTPVKLPFIVPPRQPIYSIKINFPKCEEDCCPPPPPPCVPDTSYIWKDQHYTSQPDLHRTCTLSSKCCNRCENSQKQRSSSSSSASQKCGCGCHQ